MGIFEEIKDTVITAEEMRLLRLKQRFKNAHVQI